MRRTVATRAPACKIALGLLLLVARQGAAAPPGEVTGLKFTNKTTLGWNLTTGASDYNVYRGLALELATTPPRCHGDEITTNSFVTAALPAAGQAYVYLVSAENSANEEGTPGNRSNGVRRSLLGRCDPVLRHHVLDRVTFGWNDYLQGRLNALGVAGFINEQLNPASIDESSNAALNDRLAPFAVPQTGEDLASRQIIQAVYARRQLEQVMAVFWANHFNTDYQQASEFYFCCDNAERSTAIVQMNELERLRQTAFTGTFRDILEDSAFSPAMLTYLDTTENTRFRPNENYGRELMELHTMGVDGGYTQQDVRQMARVWTGWTVCRKLAAQAADPLAPCQDGNVQTNPWTAHFNIGDHDCGAKTLFLGTPQQVNIPSTCNGGGQPTAAGLNDATFALDAVANHPSTKRFISKKLLQKFVNDAPTAAMIQQLVDNWNANNGDLKKLLELTLSNGLMRSPDNISMKVKTPLEHLAAGYRALRGQSNSDNLGSLRYWLTRLQMMPHQQTLPTGYSETGTEWINTSSLLTRQNLGFELAVYNDYYLTDAVGVLAAGGLSVASSAAAIVDYYADILLGGQITPADRQDMIDFLSTNEVGTPSPHDAERVRELFGLILGQPQGLEQ